MSDQSKREAFREDKEKESILVSSCLSLSSIIVGVELVANPAVLFLDEPTSVGPVHVLTHSLGTGFYIIASGDSKFDRCVSNGHEHYHGDSSASILFVLFVR